MTETNTEPAPDKASPQEGEAASSEQAVQTLESEIADLKDRLLRTMAEMENVRKRAERERVDAAKYAIAPFARDLAGVADNLSRALKAVGEDQRATPAVRTLFDGVALTERELLSVLERHGVKRLVPKGESFNANFHQAVAEVPAADAVPGTVLEVIEAGYVIDERLIRPAMVVIAKAVSAPASTGPGTNIDTTA